EYIFQTTKDKLSKHEVLNEFKRHLSLPTQKNIMTLAEAFVEEGRQEGRQEGLQKLRSLLLKLLERRFPGQITSNHLQLIKEADSESLSLWGEKLIDATCIEEVFIW
ncbi:MAG: hypothetical protein NT164_08635, partial [Verrucomicrobiae bacterium]|nr:hypothetical protein [Verrucomicrobiae bacterium]